MRAEFWLSLMAGSSHPGFASSAMVGKPILATGPRMVRSWLTSKVPEVAPNVRYWMNSERWNVCLLTSGLLSGPSRRDQFACEIIPREGRTRSHMRASLA